jgi:hypothetical protein
MTSPSRNPRYSLVAHELNFQAGAEAQRTTSLPHFSFNAGNWDCVSVRRFAVRDARNATTTA